MILLNGDLETLNGTGGAGNIAIHTGNLMLSASSILARTSGSGPGGKISIDASGDIIIEAGPTAGFGPGQDPIGPSRIEASTFQVPYLPPTGHNGDAGNIEISAQGTLSIPHASGPRDGTRTGIFSLSTGSTGNAGNIVASVGALNITDGGTISTQTTSIGRGGDITLTVAGTTTLSAGGVITAGNAGTGRGGSVTVIGRGPLSLSDPGSGISASAVSTASGNAGSVNVTAPKITIGNGAQIATTTAGTGAGGSVDVMTPGALVLDGAGLSGTQISASSTGMHSGPAGGVTIAAGSLTLAGGAQIASTTAGPGNGGTVQVTARGPLTLSIGERDHRVGNLDGKRQCRLGDGRCAADHDHDGRRNRQHHGRNRRWRLGQCDDAGGAGARRPGCRRTQIAASATGPQSGPGGSVTVRPTP